VRVLEMVTGRKSGERVEPPRFDGDWWSRESV
jgi:hypothetical protein